MFLDHFVKNVQLVFKKSYLCQIDFVSNLFIKETETSIISYDNKSQILLVLQEI